MRAMDVTPLTTDSPNDTFSYCSTCRKADSTVGSAGATLTTMQPPSSCPKIQLMYRKHPDKACCESMRFRFRGALAARHTPTSPGEESKNELHVSACVGHSANTYHIAFSQTLRTTLSIGPPIAEEHRPVARRPLGSAGARVLAPHAPKGGALRPVGRRRSRRHLGGTGGRRLHGVY